MTQLEIYKSFQFVAELLLAETIYMYGLRRRRLFPLRVCLSAAACFLFAFLIPVLADNAFYFSFMFLLIFASTVLSAKFAFKERWFTVVFCSIAGYTTQHLAYEMYNMLLNISGSNADTPLGVYGQELSGMYTNPFLLAAYATIYVLTYFLCWLFFGNKFRQRKDVKLEFSFVVALVIFILIIDIILNAIVVYYMKLPEMLPGVILGGVYNILCCIIALYLQFEVALRRKLESTLDTVQRMWHQVKEQYAMSKENIELINMKCHDLKHQVRSYRGQNTISSSVLEDIENAISIYDSSVKTGNDALDVILTEKSLLCNKNGVKFSSIVDGEKLDFMAEEDIYALFGNIVDNAIDAVLKCDKDKRIISLSVKEADDMVAVRAQNYYAEEIIFEDGLPQTTKKDKRYHGFGMKSIRFICEQYKGALSIKAEHGIFVLNILFFPEKLKD